MRKSILLAALVALVLVTAVPALAADVSQSNSQKSTSGGASQTFTVTAGGANSSSCQGIQGIDNSGNAEHNVGVLQFDSGGSASSSGANFEISPSSKTTCTQQVNQAASASGQ